jgi:benzodiazapine receptor
MEAVSTQPTIVNRKWPTLIAWIAFALSASLTGVLISTGEWYANLNKPTWNPPSWLFGPVWTTLYIMMGVAAWLVWCEGGWTVQRRPLLMFVVQWVLNVLWTPLFFGIHRPDIAFFEILFLWASILATLILFWRVRPLAGLLLVPYLAWVSFASFLNYTIWQMNP